jgi:hypothetical protein
MHAAKSDLSILQKVLGHDFFRMPTILRTIYGPQPTVRLEGEVQVEYGKNIFAWLASFVIPLPSKGTYPLSVTLHKDEQKESWLRGFPKHAMSSETYLRKEALVEKYGLFRFLMQVRVSDRTLIFSLKRPYLSFLPLPTLLAVKPHFVVVAQDKKNCQIDAKLFFWGFQLAAYSGNLQLQQNS